MILRIALPVPVDRLFDYLPCSNPSNNFTPGSRVRVRFGPRLLIGLIIEVAEHSEVDRNRLKPVEAVLDPEPILTDDLISLGRWAADYYQHAVGEALFTLLPVLARKREQLEQRSRPTYVLSDQYDEAKISNRARKQRALIEWIVERVKTSGKPISMSEMTGAGYSRSVVQSLLERNLLIEQASDPNTLAPPPEEPLRTDCSLPKLNQEQRIAVDTINAADGFEAFLLSGVTGSGKTEVYLRALERVLKQGQQALVLVPEIGLTPQLIARFSARFRVPVLALHSNLTDRARFEIWQAAVNGSGSILIGTRSAVFVRFKALGIIIIDEEHDASFKQQDGFRYQGRDLAILRAQREGIPIVLGSATPSLESIANAESGRYRFLELTQRAGGARAPEFELISIKNQPLDTGLEPSVISRVRATLNQGQQVLIFINRRGFAPSMLCQNCGTTVDCTRCDAHMTLHKRPARLHCHHCDRQTPIPSICAACGSRDFVPSGTGTERLEERLNELFSDTPILRVDRDTTSTRDAFSRVMQQVEVGAPCILVGTQMLAKGHHFPGVTLVVIVNADAGLFSSDPKGIERMAQLVIQVSGRAGRAQKPGTVLLQTFHVEHPILNCLIEEGYLRFAQEELLTRRQAGLPPYTHVALIQAESKHPGWGEAFLRRLKQLYLEQRDSEHPDNHSPVQLSGPFPNSMEKRAGYYRAQLLLTSSKRSYLYRAIKHLRQRVNQDPDASKVRLIIDVDPAETL